MSESTDPTPEDTTEETPEETPTPEVTEDEHQDADDTKAQNAEAAKYRRRLRDAQKELEAVTAQLDTVQRQQVESLLNASGVKPDAVWAVIELSDLLDDDGAVNTDKVGEAVQAARDKFGIPKKSVGAYVPGVGNQPSQPPKVDAWKDAFTPKRR